MGALLAVAPAGAVTMPATTASATWAIQPSPNPLLHNGSLTGVSCTSAKSCVAVGEYKNSSGVGVTLAEIWKGTHWSVTATQNPTGSESSSLNAVTCTSAKSCVAVGDSVNGSGTEQTLVEVWNGSHWAVKATPNPTGAATSSLMSVSCSSATWCAAVGASFDSSYTESALAEVWNGTHWAIKPTPSPVGAIGSELTSVSCNSTTSCVAVGDYVDASITELTLAEVWDGTNWGVTTTPNPIGAETSYLTSISCTSASSCVAVGLSFGTNGVAPIALRWNGAAWSVEAMPLPGGVYESALGTISCSSATSCVAVGEYLGASGSGILTELWNGTHWTAKTPKAQGTAQPASPGALSCMSTSLCVGVGYQGGGVPSGTTFAESWNGKIWAVEATPNPIGMLNTSLKGVSCTSATSCVAVGNYQNALGVEVTFAEVWNGKSWSVEPVANPTGPLSAYVGAVSCSSAASCVAVGRYGLGSPIMFAEASTGTHWSVRPTPGPAWSEGSSLDGVSCTSATSCVAVGDYVDATGTGLTLAERWNGKSWSLQKTPTPAGAHSSELNGVSCASATSCVAVGDYYDATGTGLTLAERWNGKSWSLQKTPNPAGAGADQLNGVSCASATSCVAVGGYFGSSSAGGLSERWNGKSWSLQKTPTPAGAHSSELNGVSCASATSCVAVGDYYDKHFTQTTSSELWNGKSWSVKAPSNPKGAMASSLTGVSCTSTTSCVAVGTYENSAMASLSLVERFRG